MTNKKIIMKIGDMSCASCAQTIEKALKKTTGVVEANVNIATEKATVIYEPDKITASELNNTIEATGYQVIETIDSEE